MIRTFNLCLGVSEKLLKMPMERFVGFLQQDLEKDFGLDDDAVVQELQVPEMSL